MHQPDAEIEQLKERMELLQKELRETKRLMKTNNRLTTDRRAGEEWSNGGMIE